MTLTEQLADLVLRPVGLEDREQAALLLLDWLGCAAAGTRTEPGLVVQDWARARSPGPCAIIGGLPRQASAATFANGCFGNVLEMDDLDRVAIVHPGPVVAPAALATAQNVGADGPALLDAIVRGYEAMIRVGRSTGLGHYRFWHTTATCGPFGAAAAAGSLLQLSAEYLVHAFGNAGTQASGLWQTRHEPSMSKQLHCGRAAQSGMLAAELAQLGFTGPRSILEGPQGLYVATCPDPRQDLLTAPSEAWLIHGISMKPWPACRHVHATIDAALEAHQELGRRPIAAASVETYREALTFCDKPRPGTEIDAKFSLQHAVAVVLGHGRPELDHFRGQALTDRVLGSIRSNVRVRATEPFISAFPHHYGARVELVATDGTRASAVANDAWGDAENPMSADDVIAKAQSLLAEGGFAAPAVGRIVDATLGLAGGASVAALAQSLGRSDHEHATHASG